MSVLLAKDELTLSDMRAFRDAAVNAAVERAVNLRIAPTAGQLTYRPFLPTLDAGVGVAIDQWRTAALVAPIGTDYTLFVGVINPVLAVTQVAVFFKVGLEETPSPVSKLLFRTGGAVGNITAIFDLEQIINGDVMEGYFSEPVVIEPSELWAAQVRTRIATGAFTRVQLGGYVVEPVGRTIAIA